MIHLARRLQRRNFTRLFTMKVPAADPVTDDVWGFLTKEKSDELVKTHRMLASMIQKSYVGPIKQQLQTRGFEQEAFQEGCIIAYKKVAEIYGQGEPVFKEKHLDIVEETVADELDQQLMRYKNKSLLPKLKVETVDARLLFLIRARKETFDGPFLVRLFNAIVSMSVQQFQPKYELLAAVEFKVRESFQLLQTSTTSTSGTGTTEFQSANDTGKATSHEKSDEDEKFQEIQKDGAAKESRAEEPQIGSRKHFFVFAADLPAGEIPIQTEADVVEFRVRSIGRAFGM